MAETSPIPTQSGRFRTSRYPGFTGGKVSSVTGNLAPPSAAALSGLNDPVGTPKAGSALRDIYSDNFDIPEIKAPSVGDMVKGVLPGVGAYYGGPLGEKFGADVGGKLFGEGVKETLKGSLPTVGSIFGSGGSELANVLGPQTPIAQGTSEAVKAAGAAGEVAGEAGGTFGGAGGAGVGSAIGTFVATGDVGKAAKSGAGAAAGYAIGGAFGGPVGGQIGSFIGSSVGGRVICTELNRMGLMSDDLLALDRAFTITLPESVIRGYRWWAVPYVRLMRRDKWAVELALPFAAWRAEEIAHQMGFLKRGNWKGKLVRLVGENLCRVIGWFVGPTDYTVLNQEKTQCTIQA